MENKEIVLSVKDLSVNFSTDNGYVQAVRGVSFDLYKGETLCIVGESGSGKSVTSKTIMGILAANGRITSGSIMYEGEDLTKVSEDEFHRIRGRKIGMIFQDPLSSLNPIMRIGKQITEAMLLNGNHLKKMREEIVANEFVAYKNAITAYNSELNKGKETVKFLKSEKKKELERIKNIAKNESDGKIYALKQDYGLEKVTIKHKYDTLIAETDDASRRGQLRKEKAQALKVAHDNFVSEKAAIKKAAKEQNGSNKAKRHEIKCDFDAKIEQARKEKSASKVELKNKYAPVIAETKAKYIEKNKEAKAKVKATKNQYFKEFVDEVFNGGDLIEARKHYYAKIKITPEEAKEKALKIMEEVGIPNPETRFRQYPFEFSGGMRQRIVIAIALTADPDILICDEPTTALDVTIQAQILELINRLKRERNMTCIFITHDLGVVANMADRVAVMYAGKIVEYGTEEEIFYDPRHPYTWALLSSIPDVDSKERLDAIPGTPPNLIYPPVGDAFALRSKYAMKIDFKKEPPLFKVSDTHYAATWLLDPRAPKVEMPAIVKTRIETAKAQHAARLANQENNDNQEEPVDNQAVEENYTVVKHAANLEFEQHSEEVIEEAKKKMAADKNKEGKRGK